MNATTMSVEELRERVDALSVEISELKRAVETTKAEEFHAEARVRDLGALLIDESRGKKGLWTTIVQTVASMAIGLPFLFGGLGFLIGVVAVLAGIVTAFTSCDEPPRVMRLDGFGSATIATPDMAPIGVRCEFYATQTGPGRCDFAIQCADHLHRNEYQCVTDSYETDSGEGGTTTSYYLRGWGTNEDGAAFSFSEYEGILELKGAEDSRLLVVFHHIEGRSILDRED